MAHHCDKCRAEYETGTFYGGHDYCMTCYVKMKQDDERKRREEARRQEERAAEKRELLRKQWAKEELEKRAAYERSLSGQVGTAAAKPRENVLEKQREAREARVQELYAQQDRKKEDERKKTEEEMKKRYAWDISIRPEKPVKKIDAGAGARGKEETGQAASGDAAWGILPGGRYHPRQESAGGGSSIPGEEPPPTRLSLEATAGLPVSLSVGQKSNSVALAGKNSSAKKLDVELVASLVDSKGKGLEMKIEPPGCGIEPGAEAKFDLKFDLKDDTPTGVLELKACLKENAIYMDREAGKSETLTLHTKVKTPLMLEYRKGSAEFSEENGILLLCLTFDNRGESGGILSTKSGVSYGNDDGFARAALEHKVKIKGRQRNVRLEFAAEKRAPLEKLALELLGVDSNGKEYRLRKTVRP